MSCQNSSVVRARAMRHNRPMQSRGTFKPMRRSISRLVALGLVFGSAAIAPASALIPVAEADIGTDEAGINDDKDLFQEMRLVLKLHRVPGVENVPPTLMNVRTSLAISLMMLMSGRPSLFRSPAKAP